MFASVCLHRTPTHHQVTDTYSLRDRGEPSTPSEAYCLRERSDSARSSRKLTSRIRTASAAKSQSRSAVTSSSTSPQEASQRDDGAQASAEEDTADDDDNEIQFKPVSSQQIDDADLSNSSVTDSSDEVVASDADSLDSGDVYSLAEDKTEANTGMVASLRSRLQGLANEEKSVVSGM